MFLQRIGNCGATYYTSLRSTTKPKENKIDKDVFTLHFTEIQNGLAYIWIISPEIVQEFG